MTEIAKTDVLGYKMALPPTDGSYNVGSVGPSEPLKGHNVGNKFDAGELDFWGKYSPTLNSDRTNIKFESLAELVLHNGEWRATHSTAMVIFSVTSPCYSRVRLRISYRSTADGTKRITAGSLTCRNDDNRRVDGNNIISQVNFGLNTNQKNSYADYISPPFIVAPGTNHIQVCVDVASGNWFHLGNVGVIPDEPEEVRLNVSGHWLCVGAWDRDAWMSNQVSYEKTVGIEKSDQTYTEFCVSIGLTEEYSASEKIADVGEAMKAKIAVDTSMKVSDTRFEKFSEAVKTTETTTYDEIDKQRHFMIWQPVIVYEVGGNIISQVIGSPSTTFYPPADGAVVADAAPVPAAPPRRRPTARRPKQ